MLLITHRIIDTPMLTPPAIQRYVWGFSSTPGLDIAPILIPIIVTPAASVEKIRQCDTERKFEPSFSLCRLRL